MMVLVGFFFSFFLFFLLGKGIKVIMSFSFWSFFFLEKTQGKKKGALNLRFDDVSIYLEFLRVQIW